jgi:hypothetical protein
MHANRTRCQAVKPSLLSVLCALYASEINVSICISSFWDAGWEVKLGDTLQGFKVERTFANAELDKAAQWLAEQACVHYPESDFTRRFAGFFNPLSFRNLPLAKVTFAFRRGLPRSYGFLLACIGRTNCDLFRPIRFCLADIAFLRRSVLLNVILRACCRRRGGVLCLAGHAGLLSALC